MLLVIAPPVGGLDTQRMVKVGAWSASSSRAIAPNWTSDATVVGHKLVVQGDGPCTIQASIGVTVSGSNNVDVWLMCNGSVIASRRAYSNQSEWPKPTTFAVPATVTDGDTIWLEAQTSAFATLTVDDASWIEVTPT